MADAKNDDDDYFHYANVQFKPNNKQVETNHEEVQYASVHIKKSKPKSTVPQPGKSLEETEYASVHLVCDGI